MADPTSAPPPAAAGPTLFPAVEVIDLATDARIDASTLTFGPRPVLIWFWAPH